MNLFKETQSFIAWVTRLAFVFLRRRPWTTIVLVAAMGIGRVTSILSFVLPIKVLSVIASQSEPGKLQSMIGADQTTLVVALLTAVILSFFTSIITDAIANRLTTSGGTALFSTANELAVVRNNYATAQGIYRQFASVTSGAVFVGVGFAVIAYIELPLIAGLAGALLVEFIFTAVVLRSANAFRSNTLTRFVSENTRNYLNALSSLNILIALGILIYPFVWGNGADVISALISFLILRRILGVASGCVAESINLAKRRNVADALFFPKRRYLPDEGKDTRTLRDVFSRQARGEKTIQRLRAVNVDCDDLTMLWRDSRVPGVNILAIDLFHSNETTARYQQQVYLPNQGARLDNEAVLFQYMARDDLPAPKIITRFDEGPYHCQICDTQLGEPAQTGSGRWMKTAFDLTVKQISATPPRALLRTYAMSHPSMADRLSDELIERLDVAADTPEDTARLGKLRRAMPDIRARVQQSPLYVYNPEMKPANVLIGQDSKALIMTWGRWALEPIGYGMPQFQENEKLKALAQTVRNTRSDVPETYSFEEIEWIRRLGIFENQIKDNLLKTALSQIDYILDTEAPPRRAK
ncbi:hypothetical protein HKX42_08880 [Salinisphaera sp. USBA-960]|nr:hypothetical protein [Salifodinibacter halophilus]NNC26987.1 hypothetical protein [Salifodinibacter halophilus]